MQSMCLGSCLTRGSIEWDADILVRHVHAELIGTVSVGIPTQDSSVNVLSTVAVLLMDSEANLSRTAAATVVADRTGLPLGRVHGLDWLQVLTLGEDSEHASAVETGLVCHPPLVSLLSLT